MGRFVLSAVDHKQILSSMHLNNAGSCVLKLKAVQGNVDIETLMTSADT